MQQQLNFLERGKLRKSILRADKNTEEGGLPHRKTKVLEQEGHRQKKNWRGRERKEEDVGSTVPVMRARGRFGS